MAITTVTFHPIALARLAHVYKVCKTLQSTVEDWQRELSLMAMPNVVGRSHHVDISSWKVARTYKKLRPLEAGGPINVLN